ncbi:unnamed protein product, partial [Mesorhabditis belari]|uniref:Uncharacterized protein n=1 Tax=Mesorhabditis belari TaxID=2138241 RepID=A0AAF3J663_9BILA
MLLQITLFLLCFRFSSGEIQRENRTVAIFELLNDVFAEYLTVSENEATPVKTLEGICIDSDLGSRPPESAPFDFSSALVTSLQNPKKFTTSVDKVGPCWPLLLVRTVRILLFEDELLEESDLKDLDDVVAQMRAPYYQTKSDSDRWLIAQRIARTLTFEMPRNHATGKLISHLQKVTSATKDEREFLTGIVDLIGLMFHYKMDTKKCGF